VGHLGADPAPRGFEPRLHAAFPVFAAHFPDVGRWLLVLAGVDPLRIPAEFAGRRFRTFAFPWSHRLAAGAVWPALGFGMTWSSSTDRAPAGPTGRKAVLGAARTTLAIGGICDIVFALNRGVRTSDAGPR
jgi:hypothetical protein